MGKASKVMTEGQIKDNLIPKQLKQHVKQGGYALNNQLARSRSSRAPNSTPNSISAAAHRVPTLNAGTKRIPSDVPTAMIAPTDYKNFYFHKKHGRDFQEAKRVPSDAPTCLREAGEFRKMFLGEDADKSAAENKAMVKSARVSTITSQTMAPPPPPPPTPPQQTSNNNVGIPMSTGTPISMNCPQKSNKIGKNAPRKCCCCCSCGCSIL